MGNNINNAVGTTGEGGVGGVEERNRIAIIWPEREPGRHPTNIAGFLIGFEISSSVVLSKTIIGYFHNTIL